MHLPIILALAAATATPAHKAHPPVHHPGTVTVPAKPDVDPFAAMAMMQKMMEKLFPAGPDPDPARLVAARGMVLTMFPDGTYAQAMNNFMNNMIDRGLSMSEADVADLVPATKKAKGAKPPSQVPFRQMLAAKEPNFDAKLATVRAFMGQSIVKLGVVVEPKFRDGMARAMARKFDARQMAEISAFLATPTGQTYGREMVGLWFEPDVMHGAMNVLPDMMKMLPDIMKDSAAFEQQFKALDKPATKPDRTEGKTTN